MLPTNTERVRLNTSNKVNDKIYNRMLERVSEYRDKSPEEISRRIDELYSEWDIERVLEANASTIVVLSSLLGFFHSRKWFILSGIVGFFLFIHAVQGWCPPLPIFRRKGVRTISEIQQEINMLRELI